MTDTPSLPPDLKSASPTAFDRVGKTPPIAGDLVEEGRIVGFCYDAAAHERSGSAVACRREFDRAIVLGEAGREPDPEYHSVAPTRLAGLRTTQLLADHFPGRVWPTKPAQLAIFTELLNDFERMNGWDVRPVLRTVWDDGYDIWLVGGAVRDSLRPLPGAELNDLDCTGTIPVGALSELLNGVVVGGQRVGKGGGSAPVVTVVDRDRPDAPPVFEYKGLDLRLPGSSEKASDHNFERDAVVRDLTINSLAFDPVHGVLLDPTGQGCDDLRTLTLRPCEETAEVDPLRMYLRVLKFVERYRGQRPNLAAAVTEIRRHEGALRDAIDREAADRTAFGQKLKSAFYSKKIHPADDPGLSRIVGAAHDLSSPAATAVAEQLVRAYEGVPHA